MRSNCQKNKNKQKIAFIHNKTEITTQDINWAFSTADTRRTVEHNTYFLEKKTKTVYCRLLLHLVKGRLCDTFLLGLGLFNLWRRTREYLSGCEITSGIRPQVTSVITEGNGGSIPHGFLCSLKYKLYLIFSRSTDISLIFNIHRFLFRYIFFIDYIFIAVFVLYCVRYRITSFSIS